MPPAEEFKIKWSFNCKYSTYHRFHWLTWQDCICEFHFNLQVELLASFFGYIEVMLFQLLQQFTHMLIHKCTFFLLLISFPWVFRVKQTNVNLLIKIWIFFLSSCWFNVVTLLGYKISIQIYWIWGWHSTCWSKISSNTIQTTINCLCRENLWLDSWQFKERIVSTIGFMHPGESYWAYQLHIWKSCSIGFECIFLSLKNSTTGN